MSLSHQYQSLDSSECLSNACILVSALCISFPMCSLPINYEADIEFLIIVLYSSREKKSYTANGLKR